MIKIEDKNDDNMFKCLKINSKFKICWGKACLTLDGVSLFNVIWFSPTSWSLMMMKSLIYLLFHKFLCKDKTINCMRLGFSFPGNDLFRCSFPII